MQVDADCYGPDGIGVEAARMNRKEIVAHSEMRYSQDSYKRTVGRPRPTRRTL